MYKLLINSKEYTAEQDKKLLPLPFFFGLSKGAFSLFESHRDIFHLCYFCSLVFSFKRSKLFTECILSGSATFDL